MEESVRAEDVNEDGYYIVEEPGVVYTVRSVWRRETGESWDSGEGEPRVMWFDCGDPSGTPMEDHLTPRVGNAKVLGRINLPRSAEPTITKFVT